MVFERGGQRHGLIVLVDHTFGGMARDAFLVENPDEALTSIRREAAGPMVTLWEITPGEARNIAEPAIAITDQTLGSRCTGPPGPPGRWRSPGCTRWPARSASSAPAGFP